MTALERIEALAYAELTAAAAGGLVADVTGGVCLALPAIPSVEVNRVAGVEAGLDLDAVQAFFERVGAAYMVSVPPGLDELERELAARGFTRRYGWMKFERDLGPAPAARTELRVEETLDPGPFGRITAEVFTGSAERAELLAGVVGRPGWHCFVGWDGDEPASAGALFVDRDAGWFGIGATRPDFRGRGGQGAILAARIERARELGLRVLVTETGEQVPERPAASYRNILRAGFREAYLRPNWRCPD